MAYNQYTKCVAPDQYSGPFLGTTAFWAALAASIGAGFVDIGATFFGFTLIGIAYCRWWLYGRLVCLGGNRCFIGLALQVDTQQDQDIAGKLDTDYSVYLLPAPSPLLGNENIAQANAIQGYLIADQSSSNPQFAQMLQNPSYGRTFTGVHPDFDLTSHDGPGPLTPAQATALNLLPPADWQPGNFYSPGDQVLDSNGLVETCTSYSQGLSGSSPPNWPTTVGQTVYDGNVQWSCDGPVLGVLEVEFEGAGVWDFYQALLAASVVAGAAALAGALAALAGVPFLGWILILIALLITLIGAIAGLADNTAESPIGNNVVPESPLKTGEIHPGRDILFVMGTWIYDSGHSGWNELHPVLFCQRIAVAPEADVLAGMPWQSFPALSAANLQTTLNSLCGMATTALSGQTLSLQLLPQNGWVLHPLVDGCTPPPNAPAPVI